MDNLMNYQGILNNFSRDVAGAKSEAEAKVQEAREKMRDFTDPMESVGAENLGKFLKDGIKGLGKKGLNKLGLTEEKAREYKKAYDSRGARGVLQKLADDNPNLTKNLPASLKNKLPQPSQAPKQNIEDLLPKDFLKQKDDLHEGVKDAVKDLTGDQQQEFTKKLNFINDSDKFGGDVNLMKQWNLNHAQNVINDVKSGEEAPVSVASLSPEDYKNPLVRNSIKSAIKTERDDLHPIYKQKYDDLLKDRIARKGDIADDFMREKFNVHQANRTLEEVKNMAPQDLSIPKPPAQPNLVSQLARTAQIDDDDDTTSNLINQAQKSVTSVYKQNVAKAANLQGDVDDATKSALNVGKKAVAKAGEKAGEEFLETEAVGGGPEDLVGDALGAAIGIGTFVGGLFGARHIHQDAQKYAQNVGFQIGS